MIIIPVPIFLKNPFEKSKELKESEALLLKATAERDLRSELKKKEEKLLNKLSDKQIWELNKRIQEFGLFDDEIKYLITKNSIAESLAIKMM